MGAGDIRAGRAFVELYGDDTKLHQVLRRAEGALRAMGQTISGIGQSMAAVGGLITAPLLGAVHIYEQTGSALHDMSDRIGIGAKALSELGFAAGQSGTDVETLEAGIKKMQRAIFAAAEGSGEARKALSQIGLTVESLAGLKPDEQFKLIAESMAAIENPTARAAAALNVFGKSGTALLPLMKDGAAGIEALQEQARRLGLSITDEAASAAENFGDKLYALTRVGKHFLFEVGQALAPSLGRAADAIFANVNAINEWIRRNGDMIVGIGVTAAALTGLGVALITAGGAITVSATAIGILNKALFAIPAAGLIAANAIRALISPAALGFILSGPFALILTAIAAAIALVGVVCSGSASEAQLLSDRMTKLREEGDRQRDAQEAAGLALQRFAARQRLTRPETNQAAAAIEQLESEYGKLGITVDFVSQKVIAAGGAFDKLFAAIHAREISQLNDEIDATKMAIVELSAESSNVNFFGVAADFGQAIIGTGELDRLVAKRTEQFKRLEAAQKRLNALRGGTSGVSAAPTPALDIEEGDNGKTAEEFARRAHQLKLQLIEDEHARELALINERYDFEAQKARDKLAGPAAIASIDEARRAELATADKRASNERLAEARRVDQDIQLARIAGITDQYQREIATINAKADFEIAAANRVGDSFRAAQVDRLRGIELENARWQEVMRIKQEIDQRDAANSERRKSIAELELRTNLRGIQLERAMLELDRDQTIERAKRAGESLDLVNKEFDLRRKFLDQQNAAELALGGVVGSFSASHIIQLGGGGAAADRTARATERTARAVERLVDRAQPMVFGS